MLPSAALPIGSRGVVSTCASPTRASCRPARPDGFDFAKLRLEYEVNALGPLRVTEALLPFLAEGSKVAIITSRVGSLGENFAGGLYGYRMSKAAANMAGICLARDLVKRGVAVICL